MEFGSLDQAEEIYQQIIEETEENDEKYIYLKVIEIEIKAESILKITKINQENQTYEDMLVVGEEVEQLLQSTGSGQNGMEIINCFQFLAEILEKMGDYFQALEKLNYCEQILKTMKQNEKQEKKQRKIDIKLSNVYEQLGTIYNNIYDQEKGLYYIQKAKCIWEKIDPEIQNLYHINLVFQSGIVQFQLGNYENCLKNFNFVKEKLEPVGQECAEIYLKNLFYIAQIQQIQGDFSKALNFCTQIYQEIEKFRVGNELKFLPVSIRVFYLEGIIRLNNKEYDEAVECGYRVKDSAIEFLGFEDEYVGDGNYLIGEGLYQQGVLMQNQELKNEGIQSYREYIRILEKYPQKIKELEKNLLKIIQIFDNEGYYDELIKYVEKLRKIRIQLIEENFSEQKDKISNLKQEMNQKLDAYINTIKKKFNV
ncbi:hypothetical protein PPERSA_06052 [Pseudocohnilembus persalinus]|uniref:Tetratricopeptide repeat protein n=1 Tax=Pseudocohnilembus persalinus TaxID=266149 RepID=A0A0V0QVU1_PSEPJ|nr:hypothetical protein PPERSA_06052 [Pseudocohnilembus persalinus]|eukprot:KRX06170.1 hypothetical protein PPERSA_06052 [Pseudocohnilembus persalinus]